MSLDRINLLYEHKAEKQPWSKEQYAVVMFVGVFVVVLGLAYVESGEVTKRIAEKAALQKNQSEIKEKLSLFASQSTSNDARRIASVQSFLGSKVQWSDMLNELSLLAPRDFWLTSLTGDASDGVIKLVLDGEATSESLFSEFALALEESFYFRNVKLKSSERVEGLPRDAYAP